MRKRGRIKDEKVGLDDVFTASDPGGIAAGSQGVGEF